jgi:uncharacterized protein
VPGLLFHCQADPAIVRSRLANRRGDASDADWHIYQQAARGWEEFGPSTRTNLCTIVSNGPPEQVQAAALAELQRQGLT